MIRFASVAFAAIAAAGCTIKTESEIKPIHITMDVNLKIDKDLDRAFQDDNAPRANGKFAKVKELLDRKAAGVTNLALLEAREGATDDDRIFIAEENIKRRKRFEEIAASSGVAVQTVQRRQAVKMRSKIPSGSGVWWQDDDGRWLAK